MLHRKKVRMKYIFQFPNFIFCLFWAGNWKPAESGGPLDSYLVTPTRVRRSGLRARCLASGGVPFTVAGPPGIFAPFPRTIKLYTWYALWASTLSMPSQIFSAEYPVFSGDSQTRRKFALSLKSYEYLILLAHRLFLWIYSLKYYLKLFKLFIIYVTFLIIS